MNLQIVTKLMRKTLPLKTCGCVIVAAGSASRMGGIDKVMANLGGEPMIARTVRAFQNSGCISEIVVVTREDLILPIMDLVKDMDKVQAVVCGGASRQESVNLGLSALSKKCKLAAIHDGARPLISEAVIDRTVRAANTYGAAAPMIPVKDTIKVVSGGVVSSTPNRETLRAVQTPQVFDFDLLRAAMKKVDREKLSVTDDCSAVEAMGAKVKAVEGDERNLKVTTPMDLKIAEMLLEDAQ